MTPGTAASVLATALLLAVCAANAADKNKEIDSPSKIKLWALLDSMGRKMPLTKVAFEEVLSTTTFESYDKKGENTAWLGEPFVLSEDLGVSDLELQVDKSGRFQYASLIVHGICIRYKEVREKYGPLVIVDSPKGHSLFDDTLVQSRQSWGSYYFVFLDIASDCLHKVALSPRKEEGI